MADPIILKLDCNVLRKALPKNHVHSKSCALDAQIVLFRDHCVNFTAMHTCTKPHSDSFGTIQN